MATTCEANDVGGEVIKYGGSDRPMRLVHFTPEVRRCWCWLVLWPELALRGPQRLVTGGVVPGVSSCAWTSVPGIPAFATREAALRWLGLVPGLSVDTSAGVA